MEICQTCHRRLSLPMLVIVQGEVRTMCFNCACEEVYGKKNTFSYAGAEEKKSAARCIQA